MDLTDSGDGYCSGLGVERVEPQALGSVEAANLAESSDPTLARDRVSGGS
jgi:hypothetical protein